MTTSLTPLAPGLMPVCAGHDHHDGQLHATYPCTVAYKHTRCHWWMSLVASATGCHSVVDWPIWPARQCRSSWTRTGPAITPKVKWRCHCGTCAEVPPQLRLHHKPGANHQQRPCISHFACCRGDCSMSPRIPTRSPDNHKPRATSAGRSFVSQHGHLIT